MGRIQHNAIVATAKDSSDSDAKRDIKAWGGLGGSYLKRYGFKLRQKDGEIVVEGYLMAVGRKEAIADLHKMNSYGDLFATLCPEYKVKEAKPRFKASLATSFGSLHSGTRFFYAGDKYIKIDAIVVKGLVEDTTRNAVRIKVSVKK